MNTSRRFFPLSGALALFAALEFTIVFTRLWFIGAFVILIIAVAVSAALTNFERIPRGWWHTLFSPLLLSLSSLFLLFFVNEATTRQFLAVFAPALCLFLWENLYRFYWIPEFYHKEALENSSLALNTTTIWFTSALFYNILLDPTVLPTFLASNILALATAVVLIVVFAIDYGTIWVQRYAPGKVWLWLIAASVIVGEVFWVTNFLPHRVEIKTFLVVLTYYLLTHLGRSHLDGTLRSSQLRRYAYITFGTLLIVFVTARWLV